MATRIQIRRDTEANWSSNDPVLASGELALSTDVDKIKIGDSSTAWSGLSYATIGQAAVESLITTAVDNLVGGAPELLDTLNELAAAIGDDESFITTINQSISDVETAVSGKTVVIVSASAPTAGPDGSESLQEGDIWYDRSTGHAYMYYDIEDETYVWVEMGGSDDIADASLGTNNHNFSTTPSNGDTLNGYVYDSNRNAWKIIRNATELNEITDVVITSAANDDIVMYNSTSGDWENTPGVRLAGGLIPLSYLANVVGGSSYATINELESYITDNIATTTYADNIGTTERAYVDANFATTSYVDATFPVIADVPALTVMTAAEWSSDTSTPVAGSINVETGGSEIKVKVGNGSDTFADLDYIPTNGSVASDIATAIADYATKADPTFSGTVSLPSTTSIGDVDATEISYLDGVTSSVQTQLDTLDTDKAPIASPTFTGTVSGIDKTMVGLSNVDNTSDADKPVSTATQSALDLKADLSGATFGGNVTITGDLTVSGTTVTVSASDLSVRDNMIYLNQAGLFDLSGAAGDGTNVVYTTSTDHDIKVGDYITVSSANPSSFDISGEGSEVTAVTANTITVASTVTDTYVDSGQLRGKSHANPDLGWAAGRYDVVNGSGYAHAGIFRDATDGVFKFFDGYTPEPDESVFIDTTDASFALAPLAVEKVVFPDGTEQSAAGVPSLTTFSEKTASYTLDTLDHKDNIVEMNMATAGTFTIPTDAALAWPVGASIDIFATGAGEITIAGDTGVTVNATPGLILRTQWSSATLLKRGANNWVVYGDLKA